MADTGPPDNLDDVVPPDMIYNEDDDIDDDDDNALSEDNVRRRFAVGISAPDAAFCRFSLWCPPRAMPLRLCSLALSVAPEVARGAGRTLWDTPMY